MNRIYQEYINFLIWFYANIPQYNIYEIEGSDEVIYEPTSKFDISQKL